MRRRVLHVVALWVAFALVHAWFIVAIFSLRADAIGDLTTAYLPWVSPGFRFGDWVSLNIPGVYPPLATAVMALPAVFGLSAGTYVTTWLVLVIALNAGALLVLTGRGGSRTRMIAGWWWLGFLLLLGPLALGRLETITAPLAIIAVTIIRRRPVVAGVLLAAGAWIKIWPGALLASAVVGLRSRVRIAVAAVATSALVIAIGLVIGGNVPSLFSFLVGQASRSLQIEAVVATPWMIGVAAGAPDDEIVWNRDLSTFEVQGGGVRETAAAMPTALAIAALVIVVLGVLAVIRGAAPMRVTGASALALTAAFVVCNAVGSPQFTGWIAPVVVLVLLHHADPRRRLVAFGAFAIAALTQGIFPWAYPWVLGGSPLLIGLLALKSALWVAMLGYGVVRLVALVVRGGEAQRSPGAVSAPTMIPS